MMKQHGHSTAFFLFFKIVLDRELQDATAEIEHAVPGGSFLPSITCGAAAAWLWLRLLQKG